VFFVLFFLVVQWDLGFRHGQGSLKLGQTGQSYSGDFQYDRRTGYGTFVENDRFTTYGGSVVPTMSRGACGCACECACACGVLYLPEGDFFEELRHGFGRQLLADGSVYEGYWELDERCGHGRMDYAAGHASRIAFYEGEVRVVVVAVS
jgi:hypothetical protein